MAEIPSEASQFSASLRVLAIDTDPTVLEFIKQICVGLQYQIIICTESLFALNLVRESSGSVDVILMELHMPDMDGHEFLQHVKKDIPVIVMSADDAKSSIMKAVANGACDYWIKPLQENQLKNIWTHAARKVLTENNFGRLEDDDSRKRDKDNSEFGSSTDNDVTGGVASSSREPDEVDESDNSHQPPAKRPRVIWTPNLHRDFVKAVKQIGDDKAVPKKILEVMNIPGLTRENIASHLQKYRHYIKSSSNEATQQNEMAFIQGTTESSSRVESLGAPSHVAYNTLATLNSAPSQASFNTLPTLNPAPTPSIQLLNHSHPEQGHPSNISIANNFPQPIIDPSIYGGVWPQMGIQRSNVLMDTLQQQQRQQSMMHLQISPQPSSLMISGNPSFVTQNISYGLLSTQPINSLGVSQIQGGNNSGFTSGAVRSFPAPGSDALVPYGSTSADLIYQENTSIPPRSLEDTSFASGSRNPNFSKDIIVDDNTTKEEEPN